MLYSLSDPHPTRKLSELFMQIDEPSRQKSLLAPEILEWQDCSYQKSFCCTLFPEPPAEQRGSAQVTDQEIMTISSMFSPNMQFQLIKISYLQFFCFLKSWLRLSIMTLNPCTIQRRQATVSFLGVSRTLSQRASHFN